MRNRFLICKIQILAILLGLSTYSAAQISAPGRDWADTTKYTKVGVKQDSIFVFFSSDASPKKGNLKAQFSDGSVSDFKWYKYDNTKPIATRFVEIYSENGVAESSIINLDRGGYKVSITSASITETYTCWVMIDEVVISSMDIYNECDFLEVIPKTLPSAISIQNTDIFRYWDIKSSTTFHSIINRIGNEYFKTILWHGNPLVIIPNASSLTLTIGNPAPLYESKYDITIINLFGRKIQDTTELLPAKAAKADFTVFIDAEGNNVWSEGVKGEAPLAIKFDTKSINADSVYWQILNDPKLFKNGGDSILWYQEFKFSEGIGITPNDKLLPGFFPVKHFAYNSTSKCLDSMTVLVEVDSSFIKSDAIPNVFSPNADGVNDYFLIKESDINVASIKAFKISILSRQGLLVYSFSGDPKSWAGWDGKLDRSKRDAPEGVYYFIIEAKGWDNRSFKRGPYKGFLYLYRGN